MQQLSDNLFWWIDTCNVYVLRRGDTAILVDFGAGDVLDELPGLGISKVTDVLMTHHHRDQGQGLARAVAAGAKVWVPAAERELFDAVEDYWESRVVWNNYNTRDDRFTLTESIPIAGTLPEYRATDFGGYDVTIIPLPGHTVGSVGLLAQVDGRQVAFTGDLISGPGKVWSLAATQWSYAGAEGLAASVLSLLDLKQRRPDTVLPSHGGPMDHPRAAIDPLVERMLKLLALRGQHSDVLERRERPYHRVLPHLLHNWTSHAFSYVLLSDSGKALFMDYGYDMLTGLAAGQDRASRRPWLYTIPTLKEQFGIHDIDVVIPTHYHDDHVAGFNLLRHAEGTAVWAGENCNVVLERPADHDLPCLWYEPIPVDRVIPLGEPVRWEEYELTLHALPGHAQNAVAIEVTVDGTRVLVTGDQYAEDGELNYVYRNRFRRSDYRVSGELLLRVQPQLLLSGHWPPQRVGPGYLRDLRDRGAELERLHEALLPIEHTDFDAEGFGAWVRPYQLEVPAGVPAHLQVEVRNPHPTPETITVMLVGPPGWTSDPRHASVKLAPGQHGTVSFTVTPQAGTTVRRGRVAADVRVGERRFGQQAEALLTVR